jgi:hypothetical protein
MSETTRPMLVIGVAAIFLAAGCATDPPSVPVRGTIQWLWINKTRPHGHMTKEQMVFRTKAEMLKVWVADGGKEEEPPVFIRDGKVSEVDFAKEIVLAVFYGHTSLPKRNIRIEQIMPRGDGLVVAYRETENNSEGPPIGENCPYEMVVVDKVDGDIEFKALPLRIIKH